ncbi:hypothetical protein XPA_006315 [Xanthoria parietina]
MSVLANIILPQEYHSIDPSCLLPNAHVTSISITTIACISHVSSATEQDRLDPQADAILAMIGGTPCLALIHHLWHITKARYVGCSTSIATVQVARMKRSHPQ